MLYDIVEKVIRDRRDGSERIRPEILVQSQKQAKPFGMELGRLVKCLVRFGYWPIYVEFAAA